MADNSKRRLEDDTDVSEANGAIVQVAAKKQKTGELVVSNAKAQPSGPARTSALLAPIMLLTGHNDQVFTLRFNPAGDVIASGSHDKQVYLWRTYGECENFLVMKGHKNAVLELAWMPDGETVVSCSADKSVRTWDALTSEQTHLLQEHTEIVNAVCPLRRGPPLLVTGSDDRTVKLWDLRARESVRTFDERFPITSVAASEGGDQIFAAGIENVVRTWDLRTEKPVYELKGHSDTVTGMKLSPDGSHLLTNAADNTLRVWDIRPYAPEERCTGVLVGHQHNFERNLLRCDWSNDGKQVAAGSADRIVYVWDTKSGELKYALPGHSGSVNDVAFHPKEPIIGSASSDKTIYLGELAS